jgi:hypothetical protein
MAKIRIEIPFRKEGKALHFSGTPTRQAELVAFALKTLAMNDAAAARASNKDPLEAASKRLATYGLQVDET